MRGCPFKVGKNKNKSKQQALGSSGGEEGIGGGQLQHPFWLIKEQKKHEYRKRVRKCKKTSERTKGNNKKKTRNAQI